MEADLSTILDLVGSMSLGCVILKSLCPVTFPVRLMGEVHSSTQSILSAAAPGPQ